MQHHPLVPLENDFESVGLGLLVGCHHVVGNLLVAAHLAHDPGLRLTVVGDDPDLLHA